MRYALANWAPDQGEIGAGGLRDARNVVPVARHYEPFYDAVESGEAIDLRARGLAGYRDQATSVHIYAGDAAKLYERNSDGSWTDRSGPGGYTATDSTRWRSAQFGDRAIFVNGQEPPQYIEMSSGSAFADLPGSPGVAQHIAQYSEFLFLGNTGSSGAELKWCSIGDSDVWTANVNQANAQVFPDGGEIRGLIGGNESLIIFQEKTIRRALYVGPPLIHQIQPIEEERGCAASGSIARVGRRIFFLAEDGFYQLTDAGAQSIGTQFVDAWFQADAQRDFYYRMSAVIDPYRKLYLCAYASVNSSSGQPDSIIIFNWAVNRWSYARLDCDLLFPILTQSVTLEDLDAIYGSIDDIPLSLDDPLFAGGVITLGMMSPGRKLATFSGAPLEAVFTTDDILLADNQIMEIQEVAPIGDCASAYVSVAGRMNPQTTLSAYSTERPLHAHTGRAPVRKSWRWARIKNRIPAGASWTKMEAMEISMIPAGDR